MGTVRASKPVGHEHAHSLMAEVESALAFGSGAAGAVRTVCASLWGATLQITRGTQCVHSVPCSLVYNTEASGTTRSEWPENPWCIQVTGCCTVPRNAF